MLHSFYTVSQKNCATVHNCSFTYLLLRSNCGTENSSQWGLSKLDQHGIQRQGHDLDKKSVFEVVHSKELDG